MTNFIEAILTGLSVFSFPTRSIPEGTYSNETGTMRIDVKAEKVLVTLPRAMAPSHCIVERGRIRVTVRSGELVFAYDGQRDTFVGPKNVTLTRKA